MMNEATEMKGTAGETPPAYSPGSVPGGYPASGYPSVGYSTSAPPNTAQSYPPQAAQGQPTTFVVAAQQPPPTTIVVQGGGGGCRYCQGPVVSRFTCCGIVCAIIFFPIGILCCFVMRKPMCASCGRDA